jgi:hypothetical protein
MSYASLFDNAMNKPMFAGAAGYGGAVRVGDVVRARQAAVAQGARNASTTAAMARPAGTGYGSLVTKGQAIAQSPYRNSARVGGGPRAVGVRNPRTTGATRPRPRAKLGGVDTGMMHGPSLPQAGKMKMSRKSLLGIGLGMGVAAGVAMNRRGEGASSGRQSMYKY